MVVQASAPADDREPEPQTVRSPPVQAIDKIGLQGRRSLLS